MTPEAFIADNMASLSFLGPEMVLSAGCLLLLITGIAVGDGETVGTQLSVVCVNEHIVTSGYYFWGQTRGPAWVTPNAGFTTAATRECEWHTNGTIKAAAGVALQRAGYILVNNTDADDAHIYLMLE